MLLGVRCMKQQLVPPLWASPFCEHWFQVHNVVQASRVFYVVRVGCFCSQSPKVDPHIMLPLARFAWFRYCTLLVGISGALSYNHRLTVDYEACRERSGWSGCIGEPVMIVYGTCWVSSKPKERLEVLDASAFVVVSDTQCLLSG